MNVSGGVLSAGNAIDVTVTSSDDQTDGLKTVNAEGIDLDILGSSRFLAHTTLGFQMSCVRQWIQHLDTILQIIFFEV